ncbi:MAG: cation diffusion facilitator family transporter [Promethearchaeia archaeon]
MQKKTNIEDLKKNSDAFHDKSYIISIILLSINIFLFILKFIFSILTNSLALQADAFDNLTDIVMVFAGFIGLHYAKKKPNEKFPYGYYKIENLVSLIISLFIFYTAYNIIISGTIGIINFFNDKSKIIIVSPIIFIFLIISCVISALVAIFLQFFGKKTNSPIIISQAKEKSFDLLTSISVLIGFISSAYGFYLLDSILGLFIAIFIFKGGYDIFLVSTKTLLDAVIEFDERTKLVKLIEKTPRIKKIESLDLRAYGKYLFLELTISLKGTLPLNKIERLKDNLTAEIKKEFPQIFKILILTKTEEKELIIFATPLKEDLGLKSPISEHFGDALYFGIIELEKGKISKIDIITNEFAKEEKRKGILIANWLSMKKIDILYVKKDLKPGPKFIFENALIDLIIIEYNSLDELIKNEFDINV